MRYRIKIIIVICILTVFGLAKPIHAEQVGLMPIPTLRDVLVQSEVVYDSGTGLYTYSYTITNPATNTGEIWTIDIDISQPPNTLNLGSAGLTIPFGVNPLAFNDVLAMRRNPAPMVPVGMQVPSGWDGGLGTTGLADFTSGDPLTKGSDKIIPGEMQSGFEFISYGIPTIRQIELTPDWVFLVETEEDATPELKQRAREIEDSLPFKTKTLGPTAPPIDLRDLLEKIFGYIDESVTLGWLMDSALATTLKTELNTARSFIDADDPSQAKQALRRFMTAFDGASSTQRTAEAYGLLFYNAQYLVDQLPDTFIPPVYKLALTPSTATLPIGTIHTLTVTYIVDNTPTEWPIFCPVTLEVTEGPNAGLVIEKFPTGAGTVTFSYTSTSVGTDHMDARIKASIDTLEGCGVNVTSPPAEVTWTGGPDLVIKLFIPPLIKSEGGKPIFITEITGNEGITTAGPSITRYFLSEDENIDPNQDRAIGERNIPSLSAGEESDGGTKEFILPNDIPAGTYYLGACADANQSVVELDEQNNCEINKLAIVVPMEPPSNQPPDCTESTPSIDSLWPPNHKLVTIFISGITDPDGDPVTITITHITQDEPVNGVGDGDTSPDGFGVGTTQAQVRAERSGTGNERVYAISFKAEDGKGGSCTNTVHVGVPHDQGKGKTPVDDGQNYDSTLP